MKYFTRKILLLFVLIISSCNNNVTVVDILDGATVLLSNGSKVSLMEVDRTEQNKVLLQERILDKEVYLFDINKNPLTTSGAEDLVAYLYYGEGICINSQLSKTYIGNEDMDSKESVKLHAPTLTELYKRTKSAIFFVYTADDSTLHQGSGFFINSHGVGVSNFHVFKGTNRGVEVIRTEDGSEYHIKEILAQSAELDYIIFQIDDTSNQVHPYVKISDNVPSIGDNVYSIGNPKGLEKTLSTGIISGYRTNSTFIQTTSEITHGSSGGALFNMLGEVVGITTAGMGEANLNFAVNINKVPYQNFINVKPNKISESIKALTVTRVVDGDTFYIQNEKGENEKIRFIGINAPESRAAFYKKKEYFGKEAKDYLTGLLNGRKVRLEIDVSKYDQFGRTLAYVYFEDGTFLNEKIIREGFAQTMTIPPNVKFQELFLAREREARQNKLGLWK